LFIEKKISASRFQASQPAVIFSHTKSASATSQPAVLFSDKKSAPATSHSLPNRAIRQIDGCVRHRHIAILSKVVFFYKKPSKIMVQLKIIRTIS